jgi:hypothetical protein
MQSTVSIFAANSDGAKQAVHSFFGGHLVRIVKTWEA